MAAGVVAESPDSEARRAFAWHACNAGEKLVLDQTTGARQRREIMRIARQFGWYTEVEKALDRAAAVTLDGMPPADLQSLLARLRVLEDCIMEGLDSPDSPPAR